MFYLATSKMFYPITIRGEIRNVLFRQYNVLFRNQVPVLLLLRRFRISIIYLTKSNWQVAFMSIVPMNWTAIFHEIISIYLNSSIHESSPIGLNSPISLKQFPINEKILDIKGIML